MDELVTWIWPHLPILCPVNIDDASYICLAFASLFVNIKILFVLLEMPSQLVTEAKICDEKIRRRGAAGHRDDALTSRVYQSAKENKLIIQQVTLTGSGRRGGGASI